MSWVGVLVWIIVALLVVGSVATDAWLYARTRGDNDR